MTINTSQTKQRPQVGRQGPESFRFRSAISITNNGSNNEIIDGIVATQQRTSNYSEFSSIGSATGGVVDEQQHEHTTSITSQSPPASRSAALKRLHQAASQGVITNNLKPRRDTAVGSDITSLPEEEGEDFVDDDNEDQKEKSQSSTNDIQITKHERNCGQYTLIAFINSKSGGGIGSTLYNSFVKHLGDKYVIDLFQCSLGNMPEDTLLKYAYDPMVRVLACGGDGTCGWIYSSLDKVWSIVLESSSDKRVHLSKYKDHLPLAICPLGTGNDLSRQFGWGGKFKSQMKEKSMITSVQTSTTTSIDRWRCIIMPMKTLDEEEKEFIPQILSENCHRVASSEKDVEEEEEDDDEGEEYRRQKTLTTNVLQSLMDDDETYVGTTKSSRRRQQNQLTMSKPSTQVFDGVFCNYFSLGFDAQIAYLFHHEREEHPEKFTSPMKNKIIYIQKAPCAMRAPKLRKRVNLLVNNDKGELVKMEIPSRCRAIVLLNIQSIYAGQSLTSKGDPRDALIEVIFVNNPVQAVSKSLLSPVMPFLEFNVVALTNNVCIRTKCPLHCQVDGEPWLQEEGVIQVKFHCRNSILEKSRDSMMNCGGCMGGTNTTGAVEETMDANV